MKSFFLKLYDLCLIHISIFPAKPEYNSLFWYDPLLLWWQSWIGNLLWWISNMLKRMSNFFLMALLISEKPRLYANLRCLWICTFVLLLVLCSDAYNTLRLSFHIWLVDLAVLSFWSPILVHSYIYTQSFQHYYCVWLIQIGLES
jgi:hypothetical protein